MAEVVGLVASGISIGTFAAQITGSIIKLKSYWDELQDIPEDVQDLIEELEYLYHLLADIEDDLQRNPVSSMLLDNTSTSRCLSHCKRGADRLKELTDDLSADIDSRNKLRKKWASTKVILKKDKLEKYKRKLERVVTLLSLAYQSYIRALVQLQPDIIIARLSSTTPETLATLSPDHLKITNSDTQTVKTIQPQTTSKEIQVPYEGSWSVFDLFGTLDYQRRRYSTANKALMSKSRRRQNREEFVIQYRAPTWLVNRAWRIQAVKASSGWTFKPRTMNIVPGYSKLFEYARKGDIKSLQELFTKREASPFDCNEYGSTALHVAATAGRYAICKLLIERGADVDYLSRVGAPIDVVCESFSPFAKVPETEEVLDTLRLLIGTSEAVPHFWSLRACPTKGARLVQELTEPDYYEQPLQQRFANAMHYANRLWSGEADVLRMVLSRDRIPSPAINMTSILGESLLHGVAINVGGPRYSDYSEEKNLASLQGWRPLLEELISRGADLHSVSSESRTPFLELIQQLSNTAWAFHIQICQSTGFELWCESLKSCGVSLKEYGAKETELHAQGLTCWDFETLWDEKYRMTSFTYGDSLSDWSVHTEERIDPVTEDSSQHVPGAWIEEATLA